MIVSRNRITNDSGGIVVGWLVKVVLVLAVLGIVSYDVVAIAYSRVTAADDARSIARAASEAMIVDRVTPTDALNLAEERAESRGVVVGKGDIVVAKDGSVTVHVHREVPTLVTQRIGPLAKFTVVDETYRSPGGVVPR